MSTPKRVASYPEGFLKIADRIEENKASIVLKFNFIEEAMKFRRLLYGFKGALQHEKNTMYPRFMATEFRVGKDATLTIACRDDADYMKVVQAALGESNEEEE